MSRAVRGLSLLAEVPATPMADNGRTLNKVEFSVEVTLGKASPKWLVEHAAPEIGMKHGREYLFYENEARAWWARYLASKRRTA